MTASPRIDAHQHFWRYSPTTHAWIDDSMESLKRDFLPEHLAPLLRDSGFDGSIVVQAQQDVRETEWLLTLAETHPFLRGVVGWVDLCAEDVRDQLERIATDAKLVGVRHVVQDERNPAFMARADFRHGIGALQEFGLAYDILIYTRQLPAASDLVRSFPEQRFVIDHAAKPDIRNQQLNAWSRDVREIAREPNVWCKLSGLVTEGHWTGWSTSDFTPYIDTVLEAFGPARVMIGSDWPVCTLAGSHTEVMALVKERIDGLAPVEQEQVLGSTAAAFYTRRA